ncbi:MAG: chemotaxis protein CheA [Spirochaetales bacterium]|nr:chemotaxis protein CheA [Spirochaetales bacterium]
MDQFRQVFIEEAEELLGTLEEHLLNLEESPEEKEIIDAVFRVMHTIKGSAAMFDFKGIVDFTHVVESVLDKVRNSELAVSHTLIDLTLRSRDHIQDMISAPTDVTPEFEAVSSELISEFHTLTGEDSPQAEPPGEEQEEEEKEKGVTLFRIMFIPDREIFLSGTKLIALLEELEGMGEYSCVPYTQKIPDLENYNPEHCYIRWEIFLTSSVTINDVRDVFIFVESSCDLEVTVIAESSELAEGVEEKRLGEILIDKGLITHNDLSGVLEEQKPVGQIMLESGLVSETDIESALEQQQKERKLREKAAGEKETTIRVKSQKLDSLVDSVGELVTAQARLSQIAGQRDDPSLNALAELIERLSTDLRDNAMGLRMVPIGTTFSRFKRLVRDLSRSLGKEINLVTKGGETELDKSVIEKLNDPLVHLIRNAVDHGIESPENRAAAGKKQAGTVTLTASYSGANVMIEIRDDGAGLNRERILSKAIEKGLISGEENLSDNEVFKLILQPGFSTAQEVTDVSGRGVGMDVVSKEIESLGGSIFISSDVGRGSSISLSLPLTLAIIEGLLVRIGEDKFVIPLASVQACLELDEEERMLHREKRLFEFRESMVPYIRLRELFMDRSELPPREHLVVTQTENGIFGIVVDEVLGDYQTVIKNLGRLYKNLQLVTGATILGDGTMALILDLNKVTALAKSERRSAV